LKPLYQLVAQYRELESLSAEDIDEQTLTDTLAGLGGEITEKATNVAYYCQNLESFADQVTEAAQKMLARAVRLRKRSQAVRDYLLQNMKGAGIEKITAPEFTIAIRKNPAAVMIFDDASVPAEFMVQPPAPPPRPDKIALKAALKAGRTIEGVWLEQAERLEIKA
jgi:hypothetical protein